MVDGYAALVTPPARTSLDGDITTPMLLRTGRRAYAAAMRSELVRRGLEDLPRNGPFVIRAVARSGAALSEIADELAVSKQAASKLIDLLVARGFIDRSADPSDRRRITLTLTRRGKKAVEAVEAGTARVDAALADALSPDEMAGFRAGLNALVNLSGTYDTTRTAPNASRPAPVPPVRQRSRR
jgi:DNA-binding MarR family transcriptional regulator